MTALTVGSEAWWQSKNGPQWTREADGNYRVTFWWRDPQGSEFHSAIQRVWVYITGVTDHHQNVFPQTMQRIAGTDVWQWQTVLSANWRGSYCFIPSTQDESFASLKADGVLDRTALREGWRQLLPQAIADPLNPVSWKGGRGHAVSALEMPQAPAQPGWDAPQTPVSSPVVLHWNSERLGNTRRVWVFTTGDVQPDDRPWRFSSMGNSGRRACPSGQRSLHSLSGGNCHQRFICLLMPLIPHTAAVNFPATRISGWRCKTSYCRRSGALRHSAIVLSARSLQGKVLAGCHRCLPGCTGRSALAACSASPVLTGGPIAAVNRTG